MVNFNTDEQRFISNRQKMWEKYEDLYSNLNFPPLSLFSQQDNSDKYELALKKAYINGLKLPEIDFITGDAQPLLEFEMKFKNEIKEAKRFRKASNETYSVALDLFAKENGEIDQEEYKKFPRRP